MPLPLNLVWYIAAAFAVIFGAQFVLGPILVYFTQTIVQKPDWTQTELGQLNTSMVEYMGQMVREFHGQGFDVVGNLHVPGALPGLPSVQSFKALLVNRSTNDLAVIIMSRAALVRSATTFFICSEFSDGTRLTTGANPGPSIFPADSLIHWQNFPWVTQPSVVCEAHRRRLLTTGRDHESRVVIAPGQERAYYDLEWDRSNLWHVQCGYRYLDETAGVYRFTVKGAILTTWKLIRPVKRVRMWLRNRSARRAWNQLGMNAYHPSDVTPADTAGTAN